MSYYFIKSKLDGNVIDVSNASTQPSSPIGAYPQKTSGTENQMWEFEPATDGSDWFFIKSQLDGQVMDIANASTTPGTAINTYPQKTSGIENQLWQFMADPAGSGYHFIISKLDGSAVDISNASTAPGAKLGAYPVKASGTDNQLWEVVGGTFPSNVVTTPKPGAGLGSNSNYLMSNCGNIDGLAVTIDVTQDIVGSDGFGFQVNGYSAKNFYDGGQQYLIFLDPHSSPAQLYCMVDNWTATASGLEQIINHIVPLATLPSQRLPAGYKLAITLANDASAKVTGATYLVTDNTGKVIGNQTITLSTLTLVGGGAVTSANMAPIVSFQMNFVDYLNGGTTVLSSGGGFIFYRAASTMTPEPTEPSCVDWDFVTVEKANSSYGLLPSFPCNAFTQTFQTAASGAVIDKQATVRHITKRVTA